MFIKQYSPHLRYKQRSLIVSILMMTAFQEALALTEQIHREMKNPNQTLDEMSKYYFDGQGKAVRPALTLIMAGACNSHLQVIFGSVRSSRSHNVSVISCLKHPILHLSLLVCLRSVPALLAYSVGQTEPKIF